MKRIALLCLALGLGNLILTSAQEPPSRQEMPPEIKRMREEMFRGLPPEIRKMFEEAFDESFFENGELPEGFGEGEGLPFEIPSGKVREFRRNAEMNELRDRQIDRNEKLAPQNLAAFSPLLKPYERSVLPLTTAEGIQVSFGTCVDANGLLVAKASEVATVTGLQAKLGEQNLPAEILSLNQRFDLALIHIEASELTPVRWAPNAPAVGTLIVTGNERGEPIATGVVSVEARPLTDQGRAFLGVEPITVEKGILINSVSPNQAAEKAGLQVGDIVRQLDGQPTTTSHKFANDIRLKRPGDKVELVITRDDKEIAVTVELSGLNIPMMGGFNREMGAVLNNRMSDFDLVFQHDTPLWPEQCGGPLIDLDGQAVGFNIARSGRVRSYAIPSGKMQELVQALIKAAKTTS